MHPSFFVLLATTLSLFGCSPRPQTATTPTEPLSESPKNTPPPAGGETCGRLANEPIKPTKWQYGGSTGDKHCDELATAWANVRHEDRVCTHDDECTVVSGDGNCINLALNRSAATQPMYKETPCGNPASGACMGGKVKATCDSGCCAVH